MRALRFAGLLLIAVLALSCGSIPQVPTQPTVPTSPPATLFALTPPMLVAPAPNATIAQNSAASGCPFDRHYGQGFAIPFDWNGAQASAGIAGYHLYFIGHYATHPLIDEVVGDPPFVLKECGFIADQNLNRWQWKVRTVDRAGRYSDWSETRYLNFAPCRVQSRPCSS